jgi:hypothetical protein
MRATGPGSGVAEAPRERSILIRAVQQSIRIQQLNR